ncbi:ATP-binding protein [Kitasatospora sp. NPDC090091]|uniref:ATP-binding protein n=1 Tax=Kitasatospora sp. NPDC090091 TaxID=3364081 RepID=UPI0037F4784A
MPEIADSDRVPIPVARSEHWLLRSRRSPGEARRHLQALLASTPVAQQFADVGLLLVSELVTNAVVHGTPIGNKVLLVIDLAPARLRIEVHDARGDRAPLLRTAGRDDESGRGLVLVKSLALRWGCCPRRGIGKIVWAEVGPTATPAERAA